MNPIDWCKVQKIMKNKYYFHVVFQGDDWYSFTVELQFEVLTFKHLSSHTSAINLSLCNYVLVSLLHIYSDTCPSSEGSHVGQKNLWVAYTNRVSTNHLSSLTSAINLSPCNYILVSLLHIYSGTFPSSEGSRVGQNTWGLHTQTECQVIIGSLSSL